ncbi:phosphonate degradation HD-domain oxygenase [Variovorax sp. RA8]|uniref:phosphonate degradation HD-domain oxygenase n=1 Tax=Variovorax sp. (strain JCM 16519 / RA8) TaxID=662548 RepID=UPI0013180E2C|nr:phosphonate degradation HD-domain oxygenase [Variovorax sp. RA8]VTU38387.1 phosphonate degradation operons associated HDIG domain protein [Variovorax sp. RA8]
MALNLEEIARLLEAKGQRQYGREAVSQLAHALQCAELAEEAGETPETIVAALLHDLGHLLAPERAEEAVQAQQQRDDLHQYIALPFLRGLFTPAVLEPVRLHVDAKRYLCAAEPGYRDTLSPASQRSLELQGGIYTPQEAERFRAQPFAAEAVRLRRYDDAAKVPGKTTPPLAHFMDLARSLAGS